MYTLLDSCLDRLDVFEFLNHVEDGLKDHYDIKMLTYLMLVRLASLCPSAALQSAYYFNSTDTLFLIVVNVLSKFLCVFAPGFFLGLDRLIEPLRATCTTKVKANSVKQEFEKQDELKRSAMRAVAALLSVPDAGKFS